MTTSLITVKVYPRELGAAPSAARPARLGGGRRVFWRLDEVRRLQERSTVPPFCQYVNKPLPYVLPDDATVHTALNVDE